jgi:hypothetical protein
MTQPLMKSGIVIGGRPAICGNALCYFRQSLCSDFNPSDPPTSVVASRVAQVWNDIVFDFLSLHPGNTGYQTPQGVLESSGGDGTPDSRPTGSYC